MIRKRIRRLKKKGNNCISKISEKSNILISENENDTPKKPTKPKKSQNHTRPVLPNQGNKLTLKMWDGESSRESNRVNYGERVAMARGGVPIFGSLHNKVNLIFQNHEDRFT